MYKKCIKKIKNKKNQLIKEIMRKQKSDKTVLLTDVNYGENGMLLNYNQNFTNKREKKLAMMKE